jgi:hypothetical protein
MPSDKRLRAPKRDEKPAHVRGKIATSADAKARCVDLQEPADTVDASELKKGVRRNQLSSGRVR